MSDDAKIEAIKEKFRQAIPHFRSAMAEAKEKAGPHGEVGLAIFAMTGNVGDGGQITARFQGEEFFEDIATLCGIGPTTDEQELDVQTKRLIDKFGAGNIRNDAVGAPRSERGD